MNRFVLKFLWLDKSIAVALDQKVGEKTFPLTEYYFWPQKDAWEELRVFLEKKPWISQSEVVTLLNQLTEIIGFWQEGGQTESAQKRDISKIKEAFPNCLFVGYE